MPLEAGSAELSVQNIGGEQIIPKIIETQIPKKTADKSKFTKRYVLDLKKFHISDKGTNPVQTANGINQALQEAKNLNKNYIIFPKGTYLISETIPIVLDHKNTIIDLNGSVLKINPNKQPRTGMVAIVDGADNLRFTNGTLLGDRYTHDYKSIKASHEGCRLLVFHGGKNLEIDHIRIEKAAGFAISTRAYGSRTRPELLAKIYYSPKIKNFEPGDFSNSGEKKESSIKVRSIKPYDLSKIDGQFEFGWTEGYQGYPVVKGRVYQAYFFDDAMKFIKMKKCLQFRKVRIPEKAKFLHLVFNQPSLKGKRSHCGRITNFKPPTDVHFHDNHIIDNRCLGFAFCGGQKWLFENNLFENNGPDVVGWAFDFEDGWELMQDIVMRKNIFKGNKRGDVVVCAGSELLFEENRFESNVQLHGRPHNYIFRKNKFIGGRVGYTTRTGIAKIHDNSYENCKRLSIVFDTKAVADGLWRKPGQTVLTPPLTLENETLVNVKEVTGTYIKFVNSKMRNVRFLAGEKTRLIDFKNCEFDNCSVEYREKGPNVYVKFEGVNGKLPESGKGLTRRIVR